MDPGGFASLGSAVESNHLLYTFVGVEPPDRLLLAQSQPPDPLFEVTAILPESVVDAAQYRVDAGCGAQATSSEFAELPVAIRCLGPSGTYSLIVEALDVNGEILAYTMKNGLTGDADVEMPAWKEPNLSASLSPGLLTGVERVDLEIGLSMTTVDFVEGLGAVKRDGDAGEFSFYSDPGSGVPAFSLLTHSEGAEFAIDGTFRPRSERTVRGGLTTSLDVALSSVLLPRLDFTAIDLAETGAVTVSWTAAGSLPGVDGGRTILSWINSEFGTNLWQLVFPPGSSVTSPPEPGGTFTGPYWPFDEAEVTMSLVELLEASYLPSYAAFRADFTAPPPAGLAYTSRRTSLEYEFVPE
jgi:hypothetical protein